MNLYGKVVRNNLLSASLQWHYLPLLVLTGYPAAPETYSRLAIDGGASPYRMGFPTVKYHTLSWAHQHLVVRPSDFA